MISASLFISKAAYTNEDAISHTINYISRLNNEHIFFYGNWSPTKESATKLFEDLRFRYPQRTVPQKVQHFWISFASCSDLSFINATAEQIAFLFAPTFPICFATHNDTDNIHVHFVLSTTSILPNQSPLVDTEWQNAVKSLQDYVKLHLGIHLITVWKNPESTINTHYMKRR